METKRILRRNKEGNKAGYNGFVYPEAGQIVECHDYINSDECGNGLHGWDDQNWRYYDDSNKGNYVVIDVFVSEGINFLGDKLKFKKGLVIYNGKSLEEAKKFMFEKYQSFIFHNDTQSAGDSSNLSAGYSSTLSAGDRSFINFRAYRNCFNIVKPSKLCIVSGINSWDEIAKSYTDLTPKNVYVFNDKIEIAKSYEFSEENISKLEEFEIFVFGSNLNGNHAGGAARFAKDNFNAKEGIGEGLTGDCYAFPTLGKDMNKLSKEELEIHVQNLFKCANENCGKIFLLTKVCCGIAGYGEQFMIDLFRNSPANIVKPKNW